MSVMKFSLPEFVPHANILVHHVSVQNEAKAT